ncbi:MAG: DUF1667 domain-containing protein [Firmicutes bacterium]|nr:DUF1667 domain-containing protein [Bacillota bacterium]
MKDTKATTAVKEEIRNMTCIVCPTGCQLEVKIVGDLIEVTGADCRRGEEYGRNEVLNPVRVLTTTVKIAEGTLPLLPVRTTEAIPKELLYEAMTALADIELKAPIKTGAVVVENLLGTGIDLVASRDMDHK